MPSYELLDTEARIDGRRYRVGDEIELTAERGDQLEAMGSVRPSGVDDHDLVDDERDLPAIMASPQGRADLAERRMAKRQRPNRRAGTGEHEQHTAQATTGPSESSVQTGVPERGREKSPGRRS